MAPFPVRFPCTVIYQEVVWRICSCLTLSGCISIETDSLAARAYLKPAHTVAYICMNRMAEGRSSRGDTYVWYRLARCDKQPTYAPQVTFANVRWTVSVLFSNLRGTCAHLIKLPSPATSLAHEATALGIQGKEREEQYSRTVAQQCGMYNSELVVGKLALPVNPTIETAVKTDSNNNGNRN